MTQRLQSLWMALLLASITMMLLQPQKAECDSFEEEIKDKCQDFLRVHRSVQISCHHFWEMFTSDFVNKDPETIKQEDYNNLLQAWPIQIPADTILFYSGTADILPLNPAPYVDVYQTIFGILGGMVPKWCGKEHSQEVIAGNSCPDNPRNMYWALISTEFGKVASGIVTVLLDGKLGYMDDSFLAQYEVPQFDAKVTYLRVLMVNPTGVTRNTCDHASLIELRRDLYHSIQYVCRYIPQLVLREDDPADWWNDAKSY